MNEKIIYILPDNPEKEGMKLETNFDDPMDVVTNVAVAVEAMVYDFLLNNVFYDDLIKKYGELMIESIAEILENVDVYAGFTSFSEARYADWKE